MRCELRARRSGGCASVPELPNISPKTITYIRHGATVEKVAIGFTKAVIGSTWVL
jgi:hypothetical protein